MAGIYIHIPFCKQACSYCDFHFSTNLSRKQIVLEAILKELDLRKEYLEGEAVSTVYFGGGTPSLLTAKEINIVFDRLSKHFNIESEIEITLEANPDDLNKQKLRELKSTPINRLSIGVQSFFEEDLQFMNRAHTSEEAKSSILSAKEYGYENLSIDLIFGSQTTTNQMWEENLAQFFELEIPHLSAYSLTIEEKTALAYQINKGKIHPLDDARNEEQYDILQREIKAKGYEQYELSNYCRNGLVSKHNTSYWFGKRYLGVGPSAHSYNGKSRQWNIRNNRQYVKSIEEGKGLFEKEKLIEKDKYHEYLITSLRTKWGVNMQKIKMDYSKVIWDHFEIKQSTLDFSKLEVDGDLLRVKQEYLFQSDEIVRALMMD